MHSSSPSLVGILGFGQPAPLRPAAGGPRRPSGTQTTKLTATTTPWLLQDWASPKRARFEPRGRLQDRPIPGTSTLGLLRARSRHAVTPGPPGFGTRPENPASGSIASSSPPSGVLPNQAHRQGKVGIKPPPGHDEYSMLREFPRQSPTSVLTSAFLPRGPPYAAVTPLPGPATQGRHPRGRVPWTHSSLPCR